MPDHYDNLETRDPAAREREQLPRLPKTVGRTITVPGFRE